MTETDEQFDGHNRRSDKKGNLSVQWIRTQSEPEYLGRTGGTARKTKATDPIHPRSYPPVP